MSDMITVAFAGPAEVTPKAAAALLNDYLGITEGADGTLLPDRGIELVFPIVADHLGEGLQTVFKWSDDVGLPFTAVVNSREDNSAGMVADMVADAAEVVSVGNVNAKVVDLLAHAEGEALLVLLWGEGDDGGDADSEMLLDLALADNIKVVDLTAGMDDMVFAEAEPEVVPEPEPEPKPAARRRGRKTAKDETVVLEEKAVAEEPVPVDPTAKPARRGRSRKAAEEPLVQEEVALTDEPAVEEPAAKPVRKSRKKAEPEAELTAEVIDPIVEEAIADGTIPDELVKDTSPVFEGLDLIKGTLATVLLYLTKEAETESLIMLTEDQGETPLATAVREALEVLEGVTEATTEARVGMPKRGRGRPRKEASDDDTTAWYMDGDGIIKVAGRGRPSRGQDRVMLTEAQVAAKREAGMVDDAA